MHSTKELSAATFAYAVRGADARLDDVLPGFTDRDRLGVVVRAPGGGAGASLLILAAVTGFYDVQRARAEPFFIYPDYFVFHAGEPRGDHRKLEIWPSHKEVTVADEPEELLRAINDRGITRLAVPDGGPRRAASRQEAGGAAPGHARGGAAPGHARGEAARAREASPPGLERESLAAARSRIVTCLAYSPGGRPRDADVIIAGADVTERYVAAMLETSTGLPAAVREAVARERPPLVVAGRPAEAYRAIGLDEALGLLAY